MARPLGGRNDDERTARSAQDAGATLPVRALLDEQELAAVEVLARRHRGPSRM